MQTAADFTLIVLHGSNSKRSESAVNEFCSVLKNVFGVNNFEVCFLRNEPFFEERLTALCRRQTGLIRVLPLLLLPGSHTENDIESVIKRAETEFKNTAIRLEGCLAADQGFIGYVANKIKTAGS